MWEKKLEWILGLVVLIVAALLANGDFLPAGGSAKTVSKRTVVIDPGHGGIDPGKIGVNDAKEKEINLQIALRLKECLEKEDVAVVMTRETDDGLYSAGAKNKKREDMERRCAIIREAEPDVAVSIHQNSYHQGGESGCQVFYYQESKEGEQLAVSIQEEMAAQLKPARKREAKPNDSYYMLRHTAAPAVIVECGFLSNWNEAQKLCTEEYQRQVAQAVADGILHYFSK